MDKKEKEEPRTFFREAWPDWVGRDPKLIEPVTNGDELVEGCYHTRMAPTDE